MELKLNPLFYFFACMSVILARPSPSCVDQRNDCQKLKTRYTRCDLTKGVASFMKSYCPKTCGFCPIVRRCGVSTQARSRIVSGSNTTIRDWPWMGSLHSVGSNKFHCGATLISPNWAMSAVHCLMKAPQDPKKLYLSFGKSYLSKPETTEQKISVKKILPHPDFGTVHDMVLYELSRPAVINDYVRPVCLPKEWDEPQLNDTCYVTGWGQTSFNSSISDTLQEGQLPILPNSYCNRSGVMCAGWLTKGTTSTCYGDSGGPLVCRKAGTRPDGSWQQYGITSYGKDGCKELTVFAAVSHNICWLKQVVSDLP